MYLWQWTIELLALLVNTLHLPFYFSSIKKLKFKNATMFKYMLHFIFIFYFGGVYIYQLFIIFIIFFQSRLFCWRHVFSVIFNPSKWIYMLLFVIHAPVIDVKRKSFVNLYLSVFAHFSTPPQHMKRECDFFHIN